MPKRPWAEGDDDLAERQRTYNRRLGHLIATERELAGMLQKDLALRMGMSERQWQRVEAGRIKHSPTIFFVREVAAAIGVPLAKLLPENGEPGSPDVEEPPSAG